MEQHPLDSGEYEVAEGPREYAPENWAQDTFRDRYYLTRGQAVGLGVGVVVTGLLLARWLSPPAPIRAL